MHAYTSIPTSSPPTTPPSTIHSRAPSISVTGLPVYSSNRFKRRIRGGILWAVLIVTTLLLLSSTKGGCERFRAEEEDGTGFEAVEQRSLNQSRPNVPATTRNDEETVAEGGHVDEDHESLASLPFCRKTFLFRFAGLHGQGSELNLLLRLSTLSTLFNYTLLLDSSQWNYGPFTSYFEPLQPTLPLTFPSNGKPSLRCRPPGKGTKRVKVKLNENDLARLSTTQEDEEGGGWIPDWAKDTKHVVWGPQRDMDGLDQTVLKLFTTSTQLDRLHRKDSTSLLEKGDEKDLGGLNDGEETIPEVFGEIFERLSDQVKRIWRVNREVQDMVDELEQRLDLPPKMDSEEGEKKRVGDLVIGVHVRLGDKYLETDRIGPAQAQSSSSSPDSSSSSTAPSPYSSSYTATPGLHDSMITNYFAAAIKSVNNLLDDSPVDIQPIATLSSSREEQIEYLMKLSAGWEEEGKATMVLMSDDEGAVEKFRAHPLAERFRVVGTSESAVEAEEEDRGEPAKRMEKIIVRGRNERRKLSKDQAMAQRRRGIGSNHRHDHGAAHWKIVAHQAAKAVPKEDQTTAQAGPVIPAGFNEITFNSLPLSDRISQSRFFVRDVTFLSTRSDALVITGSSNVGRLMSLLMGERGKRNIRSLDTRWFPTAKFA
ncbi:uncharacterized protein JCM6883_003871 [Sporobolomyces salmoneus]|uniref:uncharacterized protein n=1 Tax=Sporobolomyces salmoneus TaxID=183962 RepID=UPI003176FB1B